MKCHEPRLSCQAWTPWSGDDGDVQLVGNEVGISKGEWKEAEGQKDLGLQDVEQVGVLGRSDTVWEILVCNKVENIIAGFLIGGRRHWRGNSDWS